MTFDPSPLVVYADGAYVNGAEASVPIWDHGFLYGDGVFEGIRVYDGALFRPRDHIARLGRSARAIGLQPPLDPEELFLVIQEVVTRSLLRNAHVRPVITRGVGTPTMDPSYCERPTQIVAAYPLAPILGTEPIRVMISSVVRKAPRSIGAHVKSLNYLDAILAKQQAKACGMHDAVMLDAFGAVAECTGANLFMVWESRLVTPTTRAALPGITRRTIIEIAHEKGIETEARDIWPAELHSADAVFLTGSGAGVVAVAEVDGRHLPTQENPIAMALADAYALRVRDPRFIEPLSYSD